MSARINFTFPTMCHKCGEDLGESDPRVGLVRAGSAWQGGSDRYGRSVTEPIEDGALLFTTETYHVHHAPEETTE